MYQRGNEFLAMVTHGGDDKAVHQLLKEFFGGYPVENLRSLLDSSDVRVAKAGAWITSELGSSAAPLLDTFSRLLVHPSRYVRFYILDAVLVCARETDGELLATAIRLLRDVDEAVRWKGLMFIARAARDQLAWSVPEQVDAQLANLTTWLIAIDGSGDAVAEVVAKLNGVELVERLFGVAGAYRLSKFEPQLLRLAAESTHPEVASFATEQLRLIA